jgi:DNA processing protein
MTTPEPAAAPALGDGASGDHALGCAALLAGLPGMGPRRLSALLGHLDPVGAWALATSGALDRLQAVIGGDERLAAVAGTWARDGHGAEPEAVVARHRAHGVTVALPGQPGYPTVLADDVEPPAVLFLRGPATGFDRPRVAVVGTRRCTGVGAGVARELGHDLAASGVTVVSGLALGIDGAAHRGALRALERAGGAAPPVGVVGCGLDVVYPARHRDLWEAVGERGLLLGEAPLGARPTAWRFPARNRIIAALADIVVVVESHAAGGSLHTVTEAERRDRPVMVVPGSVRSPATAGTHQLLAEGCHPVRDATDVLVALGLTAVDRAGRHDRRPAPGAVGAAVLEAFAWEPATLEHLVVRTGLSIPDLAVALEQLQAGGWVAGTGGWFERVAAP